MRKTAFYAFMALAAIALISGCTGCDTNSDAVWELRLVPLGQTELAKACKDKDGSLWLPAAEAPEMLAKPLTGADIDFGDVLATKSLFYVLMNVGNRDVFNVSFSAESLMISPEYIAQIPAAGEGGKISACPL